MKGPAKHPRETDQAEESPSQTECNPNPVKESPSQIEEIPDPRRLWFIAVAIGAFAILLHIRTLAGPFLEFDDQYFIGADPAIRSLSLSSLATIFTEPYFANFHPLTRLSYALDHALWGSAPMGYHAHSLLWYGVGAGLVFALLHKLLRDWRAAALAALLYAAHATHVEVVAWLSARKDLLCLVFSAGSLLLFLKHRERERFSPALYAGLLACCLCAGWSKSLAVVLPVLFLALDLLWFRRFRARYLADLLPVVALMVWLGLQNMAAQDQAGAIKSASLPWLATGSLFLDYLYKTVLPVNLSARYVFSPEIAGGWTAYAGIALLAGLLVLASVLALRGGRLFPAALAWFLIPLLPVSNVIVPLSTPMADRYLFWPTLAWCFLVGGWLKLAGRAGARTRRARQGAVLALVLVCSGFTAARCEVWLSDRTLWEDALRKDPQNYTALSALGHRALTEGRLEDAESLLKRAVTASRGTYSPAHIDYGRLLHLQGRPLDALEQYDKALALEGETGWQAYRAAQNRAMVLAELGRTDEAEAGYKAALELIRVTPDSPVNIYLSLGKLYFDTRRFAEAEEVYLAACAQAPRNPCPRFYVGLARLSGGKPGPAETDFRAALQLHDLPADQGFSYADVHLMLGKVYQEHLDRPDLAVEHYRKVLALNPDHPQRAALEAVIQNLSRR